MKNEDNTEELLAQIAALNNLFDEVRLIDPQTASVLDPVTLQVVGQADNLPILGEDGRALRYLDGEEDFVLYQAITLRMRPLLLAARFASYRPSSGDRREALALDRTLSQCQQELVRDYVTGAYNRRYLDEVFQPLAVQKAAEGPVCVVLVRVNEYGELCSKESRAAADCCLNTAAGILQLAVGTDADQCVLARLEDGVFAAAAVGRTAADLSALLREAMNCSRREFNLSLSRRGHFTVTLAGADWGETGRWDMTLSLAQQRLFG